MRVIVSIAVAACVLAAAGPALAQAGGDVLADLIQRQRDMAERIRRAGNDPPAPDGRGGGGTGPCQPNQGVTLLGITSGATNLPPMMRLPPNHSLRQQYEAARRQLDQAVRDNPPAIPGRGEDGIVDSGVLLFMTFVRLSIESDIVREEERIAQLSAELERDPTSESTKESLWSAQKRRLERLEQKAALDLKDAKHQAATAPILGHLAALEAQARALCEK